MSAHWFKPAPPQMAPRRAAHVGQVHELPVLEQGAILLLRQWCDGDDGRTRISEDFASVFSTQQAAQNINHLGYLITLLVRYGRRPLVRHDLACGCFGGDESVFAQMIGAAVAGEREDAMAFALTLLAPEFAYEAVQAAEAVGHAILNFARALQRSGPTPPTCH